MLLVGLVALSAGPAIGAAAGGDDASEEVRIIDEEITIADGTVTIEDTTLEGTAFPDRHVEHERITVEESTIRFDGFHVTYGDTRYTFCRIVVHVDDVGLILDDVGFRNTG